METETINNASIALGSIDYADIAIEAFLKSEDSDILAGISRFEG